LDDISTVVTPTSGCPARWYAVVQIQASGGAAVEEHASVPDEALEAASTEETEQLGDASQTKGLGGVDLGPDE